MYRIRSLTLNRGHIFSVNKCITGKSLKTTCEDKENIYPQVTYDDETPEKKIAGIRTVLVKKLEKPPFVKNLFLGKFDREVLTYPEMVEQDQFEMLQELVTPIENFFHEEVDSMKIDREGRIPSETLEKLKQLGLYGLEVPEDYGGLDLCAVAQTRIAEIIALDGSIALTLSAHQSLGLKSLLLAGSEEQKQKYLPKLSSGEWTAALCLTEANCGSDMASTETVAIPSDDGKGYYINGTKTWITNGETADLITVLARIKYPNKAEVDDRSITLFLVEKNSGGISKGTSVERLGVCGANIVEVKFENTFVPAENILGEIGSGFKIVLDIQNSGRFTTGSASAGILKDLIRHTISHAVTRRQFGNTLSEFPLIQDKLARAAIDIYAMESLSYLTAGLIDTYENQDVTVESAIVKVFSSERLVHHISKCFEILGGKAYLKEYPYERILRDCLLSPAYDGTNDILRLFIALSGLNHAGKDINELVKKLRNPYLYPHYTFKRAFVRLRGQRKKPRLNLDLHEYLHPSLREAADKLESYTIRLQYAVEDFMGREGADIILPKNQLHLKRLAEVAIDLYTITAVIGRASRSHCIGVHNSDQELRLATFFVLEACQRMEQNLDPLSDYACEPDVVIQGIARAMYRKKGYPVEHPLTVTFW